MPSLRLSPCLLPLLAVLPAVLLLSRTDPARRPQVASGGDVLSVVFGDAKAVLSAALVHKADSYFHGGVDMDYDCGHAAHGEHDADRPHEAGSPSVAVPPRTGDPWRWINAQVRAPALERHLAGEEAVELMPWFWASVRANPRNVEAWTATWYTAAHVMKDRTLAGRVIEEARRFNPDSPEIALTEGQHLYDRGRGDLAAAAAAFRRARDLALARAGGDRAKLSEDDARTCSYAENYLRKIANEPASRPIAEESRTMVK